MTSEWSREEDQLLREAIKTIGIKWEPIRLHMRTTRSLNSLIKRWHCKLKYQQEMFPYQENPVNKTISEYSLNRMRKHVENNQDPLEDRTVQWKKNWTDRDDKKLKWLVIESGILNWNTLAEALETQGDEIKLRWRKVVYPKMIKQSSKVGGALKWSSLEDKILNVGYKQNINWQDIFRIFLPHRTLGSLEARWRRVHKRFEGKQNLGNKHLARKEWLRRMGMKNLELQKQDTQKQQKVVVGVGKG